MPVFVIPIGLLAVLVIATGLLFTIKGHIKNTINESKGPILMIIGLLLALLTISFNDFINTQKIIFFMLMMGSLLIITISIITILKEGEHMQIIDFITSLVITAGAIWLIYTDWGTYLGWAGVLMLIPACGTWWLRYKRWQRSRETK